MSFILSLFFLCAGASSALAALQCTMIPGKLKQIDAGAGKVYGVNDNGDIYRWVNNNWEQVPGQLIHVSVGPAGVWGVNKANSVLKLQDNKWISVTVLLKQVDAGGDKFLGGVNTQDNVFCLKQSCTVSKASIVTFSHLDGSLKYYSCGPIGCWGVNSGDDIYFRFNMTPEKCEGTQWQHVGGKLSMVEVGTDGSVYGVNSAGHVYKRDGISVKTPIGTGWTYQDACTNIKHVTYDAGFLWLLSQTGDIYKCATEN